MISRNLIGFLALGILAGCQGGADEGAPIPDRKAPTAEQIKEMPPEAQRAAENAARAGDFQSQRMKEMAEAQRKATGGN